MIELKASEITSAPEEKQSFSFSKDNNGVTKTVRGEQAENGWIVTIDREWYTDKDNSDDRDWHSETKRFITTTDPRESVKKDEGEDTSAIGSLISDIAGSNGMLIV